VKKIQKGIWGKAKDNGHDGRDNQWHHHERGSFIPLRELLRGSEKGAKDNWEEIGDVQNGAQEEDHQKHGLVGLQSTQTEVPLAQEATDGRDPRHSQCPNGKCPHGDRHLPPDAIHLADIFHVCLGIDGPRCEKQCDLHDRVVGDVENAASE